MHQYAVHTQDPNFIDVARWIDKNKIRYEQHLNRTRFWVPIGILLTEFIIRWGDTCYLIKD